MKTQPSALEKEQLKSVALPIWKNIIEASGYGCQKTLRKHTLNILYRVCMHTKDFNPMV